MSEASFSTAQGEHPPRTPASPLHYKHYTPHAACQNFPYAPNISRTVSHSSCTLKVSCSCDVCVPARAAGTAQLLPLLRAGAAARGVRAGGERVRGGGHRPGRALLRVGLLRELMLVQDHVTCV